jgi:hypothetical protein
VLRQVSYLQSPHHELADAVVALVASFRFVLFFSSPKQFKIDFSQTSELSKTPQCQQCDLGRLSLALLQFGSVPHSIQIFERLNFFCGKGVIMNYAPIPSLVAEYSIV